MNVLIDWNDSDHSGSRSQPCRLCGGSTWLLDDARRPSHKTCAERELAAEMETRR